MKNINFNIIKIKKQIKNKNLNIKTKIKCKQGEFENFLIPTLFNFLNETSLGIEKNKRAGSG